MASKHDEERELLELQCELARLKLAATHRKKLENQYRQKAEPNALLQAVSALPVSTWKLALVPKQFKYNLLMLAIKLLTKIFGKK